MDKTLSLGAVVTVATIAIAMAACGDSKAAGATSTGSMAPGDVRSPTSTAATMVTSASGGVTSGASTGGM